MKIKSTKRLQLNRETVRILSRNEMAQAAGGGPTGACTYSGCQGTGCTTDTTGGYSKIVGHCPSTIGF